MIEQTRNKELSAKIINSRDIVWTKYAFMRNREITTLLSTYFTQIYQLRHINTKLTAHTSVF